MCNPPPAAYLILITCENNFGFAVTQKSQSREATPLRYYIRLNGRPASITISDTLSQYLVLARGGESDRYGNGKKMAQRWINELAQRADVPDKDISQWVQARIVDHIVSNELWDRLQELKPKIAAKIEQNAALRAQFLREIQAD